MSSLHESSGFTPPRKKGRRSLLPDDHECGPCQVWVALGSMENLQKFHNIASNQKPRHPGDEATATIFSEFLSRGLSEMIVLRPDSCMCPACHRDCSRPHYKYSDRPRWQKHPGALDYHCIACHAQSDPAGSCSCASVQHWAPDDWLKDRSDSLWSYFLRLEGSNIPSDSKLCSTHFASVQEAEDRRSCCICTVTGGSDSMWDLVRERGALISSKFEIEVGPFQWVCDHCGEIHFSLKELDVFSDLASSSPYTRAMARACTFAREMLDKDGYIMYPDIMHFYKDVYVEEGCSCDCPTQKLTSFKRYFGSYLSANRSYHHDASLGSKKIGGLVYNDAFFTARGAAVLYSKLLENKQYAEQCTNSFTADELRSVVKEQCAMMPSARTFDYRTLFSSEDDSTYVVLSKFLHPRLQSFLEKLGQVSQAKTPGTANRKRLQLQMLVSLMCNFVDHRSCFLQTLLGLFAYSNGLRDKGFSLLGGFGILPSIRHIRNHGMHWTENRHVIDELDPMQFWRVTADNLDFKMAYAKKLFQGSPKRMLHLITGQVSHATSVPVSVTAPSVSPSAERSPDSLVESDIVDLTCQERTQHNLFASSVLRVVRDRLAVDVTQLSQTMTQDLHSPTLNLPCFTPVVPDVVVYATVREAQASSPPDVAKYLFDLKADLKIGQEGYPKYVVVGGDQQVYAIVKNLKKNSPSPFSWVYPVPGDWHCLKTMAEVLKTLLWEGGFHELAVKCGLKREVTRWQDIHSVLVTILEALLRMVLGNAEHSNTAAYDKISSDWCEYERYITQSKLVAKTNEVYQFWIQMIEYLLIYYGYYFAIRSGNWSLRNASLKLAAELLFAYARDKYEVLVVETLGDSLKYPLDILKEFEQGRWTASKLGLPYRNQALDEFHETEINRGLKDVVSRPSHFRAVELCDFMAYLRAVVEKFQYTFQDRRLTQKKFDPLKLALVVAEVEK